MSTDELAALDGWQARLVKGKAAANIEALFDGLASPFARVRDLAARELGASVIRDAPDEVIRRLTQLLGQTDEGPAREASGKLAAFLTKARAADKKRLAPLVAVAWSHPSLDVARAAAGCAGLLNKLATEAHHDAWSRLVQRCVTHSSPENENLENSILRELTKYIGDNANSTTVANAVPLFIAHHSEFVREQALFALEVATSAHRKRGAPLVAAVASLPVDSLAPRVIEYLKNNRQFVPPDRLASFGFETAND